MCIRDRDKATLKSERIGSHEIYNLRVSSEYVYYTVNKEGEPGELYKAGHDQTEPVQLTLVPAFLLEAGEGCAYYYALATGYCLSLIHISRAACGRSVRSVRTRQSTLLPSV